MKDPELHTGAEPLLLQSGEAGDPAELIATLERAWQEQRLVALADPAEAQQLQSELIGAQLPVGAGVLVGSGGSSGGRRWCLQPLAHLQASAAATAHWLEQLEIDPARCLHLNPLPLHHVSGLLPLLRAQQWAQQRTRPHPWAESHRWLPATLLRQPQHLADALPHPGDRPVLLSLVPTQLARLLEHPTAVAWLRGCAVIWVGGAALPQDLARRARHWELPLAPCYGATETAAMVCALAPQQFLAGDPAQPGCGFPLEDVELRLEPQTGAVQLRTARLSPGWLAQGLLQPLPRTPDGWWTSGDGGVLTLQGLHIQGRLDGAISSGGETVFPEQLEERLRQLAAALPLQEVLLLGVEEPPWGQRLVALVRGHSPDDWGSLQQALPALTAGWRAAERPRRWLLCPDLAPTATGKWQRGRWQQWLASLQNP
ncbi:AMP-binding protein [Synechococcus sp. CBW1107]|uniref:AMP-binding protein n=1 Tax=Synechococcus sp. CBW1107 TaxID=2789857 RepID=UPI002AD265B5|nr:AMP-binding protein [Synechococcus sp. CBW1107]CAK6689315.1 2-succinylbenzoate--CoA ligase [Synechococcus sp. CBW1107]